MHLALLVIAAELCTSPGSLQERPFEVELWNPHAQATGLRVAALNYSELCISCSAVAACPRSRWPSSWLIMPCKGIITALSSLQAL